MKKLFIVALTFLPLSLLAQGGAFTLKGKLGSLNAPLKIFLNYHTTEGVNFKDSCVLKNGSFQLTGQLKSPVRGAMLYLKRNPKDFNNSISIWIEPGITIINGTDSLRMATISRSKLNDDDRKFNQLLKPFDDSIYKLINMAGAGIFEDRSTDTFKAFKAQKDSITKRKLIVYRRFILANPNSLVSLVALQNYGSLKYSPQRGIPEVEPLYNGLSAAVKNSVLGEIYKEKLEKWKTVESGKVAQDFTLYNQEEKPVKFSAFKGKYILLDFWASWCHPCREENPNLIKQYELYKDKNFTIVGVTLDTKEKREQWLKAIKHDGLIWTQLTGDIEDNEARLKYGVQSIPDNFLINPDGFIIAKGLRGDELNNKLKEIFADTAKARNISLIK